MKEGGLAWYSFPNGLDSKMEGLDFTEKVEAAYKWHDLIMTNVDWELLERHYDVEECRKYGHYWWFESEKGILTPYIQKWAKEKKEAAKGSARRARAKLMLNSVYGRFALKPERLMGGLALLEGLADWDLDIIEEDPVAYLPYAIFCTSWARKELLDRAQKVIDAYGVDSIVHMDTDSVFYEGEPLGGYGKEIGDWDLESTPDIVYEGGLKRYIEVFEGKPLLQRYNVGCAGVPQPKDAQGIPYGMWLELLDDPKRIMDRTELGNRYYKVKDPELRKILTDAGKDPDRMNTLKLLPRRVKGGVILEGVTHTLSTSADFQMRLSRVV